MNHASVAPCGLICDICLGFKRSKNKCAGCNNTGKKPNHCTVCGFRTCIEKNGNEQLGCIDCGKFPCRRMKDLEKRYRIKYGESPIQNLTRIKESGLDSFIAIEMEKWKCDSCGQLLCVHKGVCLICGALNKHFPKPN